MNWSLQFEERLEILKFQFWIAATIEKKEENSIEIKINECMCVMSSLYIYWAIFISNVISLPEIFHCIFGNERSIAFWQNAQRTYTHAFRTLQDYDELHMKHFRYEKLLSTQRSCTIITETKVQRHNVKLYIPILKLVVITFLRARARVYLTSKYSFSSSQFEWAA